MGDRLGSRRKLNQTNIRKVPNRCGVYVIRNRSGDAQYIGMTRTLKTRLKQHLGQMSLPGADSFQIRTAPSSRNAKRLEKDYIKRYRPKYNIQKNK